VEQAETTQTGVMTPMDDKSRKTIGDYVGDMVAMESHIEAALDRQLEQVKDDPIALEAVRGFHETVRTQRDRMKALQEETGSTAGNPVKHAGSAILGIVAGIIDKVRTEGNSKSLRDDYTAFNLAAMGYTMLYTTATALDDQRVASVAELHLRGYAEAVQRINHIIGDVVLTELAKDGHQIRGDASEATQRMVDAAWKQTDQAGKKAKVRGNSK
jgi:ferritin-like metal-binding protein YciE